MTKNTQGPWSIGAMKSGGYAVDGANGEEITGWIDSTADASLISAAPELLEILQKIVAQSDAGWAAIVDPLVAEARVAISKATGYKQ